jgi:pyruvyl transferase EpsI
MFLLLKTKVEQRVLLVGTPEHGNVGDHAIAEAERLFFRERLAGVRVVEITGEDYRRHPKFIAGSITGRDKIVITGGGFLGDLWLREEFLVRDLLARFPVNPVVIFPQTIFFTNTAQGRSEMELSKRIFQHHENLVICLRDQASFDFAEQNLTSGNRSRCLLIPDMVTYLQKSRPEGIRKGILLCFREDREQLLTDGEKRQIGDALSQTGETVNEVSTVVPHRINRRERSRELEAILGQFRKARLVITDRLHGMLFAAITGTPCIALNNSSGKLAGVYPWIRHLDYVVFVETIEEIPRHAERLMNLHGCQFQNDLLLPYFELLAETMKFEREV